MGRSRGISGTGAFDAPRNRRILLAVILAGNPWWAWFLPFLFGAPWLVALVWYWRRGWLSDLRWSDSAADLARNRLWKR